MAWQLVYTSAPRLLDAGRSGFGTVARHRDIPQLLVMEVERVSQFARLPGMDPERVVFAHRHVLIGVARYHVLSMVRSSGSDYSGRTNHIAQHLIATDREARACAEAGVTPADVLLGHPWLTAWDDQPMWLDATHEVALVEMPQTNLDESAWAALTGDPKHAWLLVTDAAASRRSWLRAPSGTDFRYLFLESLRGQPNSWQPTWTTKMEPTDDPAGLNWIGSATSLPTVGSSAASGRVVLDLTRPETLPAPQEPKIVIPPPTLAAPEKAVRSARLAAPMGGFVEEVETDLSDQEKKAKLAKDVPVKLMPKSPWDSTRLTSSASDTPRSWEREPTAPRRKGSRHLRTYVEWALVAILLPIIGILGWRRWKEEPPKKVETVNKPNAELERLHGRKNQVNSILQSNSIAPFGNEVTREEMAEIPCSDGDLQGYGEYVVRLVRAMQNGDLTSDLHKPKVDDRSVSRVIALEQARFAVIDLCNKVKADLSVDAAKWLPHKAFKEMDGIVDAFTKQLNEGTSEALFADSKASFHKTFKATLATAMVALLKDGHSTNVQLKPSDPAKWQSWVNSMKLNDTHVAQLLAQWKESLNAASPNSAGTVSMTRSVDAGVPQQTSPVKAPLKNQVYLLRTIRDFSLPIHGGGTLSRVTQGNGTEGYIWSDAGSKGFSKKGGIDPFVFELSADHKLILASRVRRDDLKDTKEIVVEEPTSNTLYKAIVLEVAESQQPLLSTAGGEFKIDNEGNLDFASLSDIRLNSEGLRLSFKISDLAVSKYPMLEKVNRFIPIELNGKVWRLDTAGIKGEINEARSRQAKLVDQKRTDLDREISLRDQFRPADNKDKSPSMTKRSKPTVDVEAQAAEQTSHNRLQMYQDAKKKATQLQEEYNTANAELTRISSNGNDLFSAEAASFFLDGELFCVDEISKKTWLLCRAQIHKVSATN